MVAQVQLPTQGADQAENLGTRGGEEGCRDVRAVPQFLCYLLDSLAGRRGHAGGSLEGARHRRDRGPRCGRDIVKGDPTTGVHVVTLGWCVVAAVSDRWCRLLGDHFSSL